MFNDDKQFIEAMVYMKEYCLSIMHCTDCPMYDNCGTWHTSKPSSWFIPDIDQSTETDGENNE